MVEGGIAAPGLETSSSHLQSSPTAVFGFRWCNKTQTHNHTQHVIWPRIWHYRVKINRLQTQVTR